MVISEQQRWRLRQRLIEALGTEEADTLMEHLPPVGWADVARTADVERATALLRSEAARTTAELRAEMAELRAEMREGFADVRREMREGFADLAVSLNDKMTTQTRVVMIGMASMVVAVIGSMTGAAVALGH